MTDYYLREIMYELYAIADATTNGKAEEARKKRWERDREMDAIKLKALEGKFDILYGPGSPK